MILILNLLVSPTISHDIVVQLLRGGFLLADGGGVGRHESRGGKGGCSQLDIWVLYK